MNRRDFSSALLASGTGAALFAAGAAHAQGAEPAEGKEYTKLDPPQPVSLPKGKVEVIEFFSYACPHCSAFEPMLSAWARALPADVVFHRVPVPFLYNAENLQKTYYALETIGAVDAVQSKIFAAIHVDKQRLDKVEDIAAVVAKAGADPVKFTAAFKSFSVATSVSRAKKMVTDYKIESVPAITVQGRYLTSPALANGSPQSLVVTDALIQRARKG